MIKNIEELKSILIFYVGHFGKSNLERGEFIGDFIRAGFFKLPSHLTNTRSPHSSKPI